MKIFIFPNVFITMLVSCSNYMYWNERFINYKICFSNVILKLILKLNFPKNVILFTAYNHMLDKRFENSWCLYKYTNDSYFSSLYKSNEIFIKACFAYSKKSIIKISKNIYSKMNSSSNVFGHPLLYPQAIWYKFT